jgi:hypothetical protein
MALVVRAGNNAPAVAGTEGTASMSPIDSWTTETNGITYRVDITRDDGPTPMNDGDWADADDIAAWEDDDWQYVDVTVTPTVAGSAASASLGAVVWGTLGNGTDIGRDVIMEYPVPELIEQAHGNLVKLRDRLNDLLKDDSES